MLEANIPQQMRRWNDSIRSAQLHAPSMHEYIYILSPRNYCKSCLVQPWAQQPSYHHCQSSLGIPSACIVPLPLQKRQLARPFLACRPQGEASPSDFLASSQGPQPAVERSDASHSHRKCSQPEWFHIQLHSFQRLGSGRSTTTLVLPPQPTKACWFSERREQGENNSPEYSRVLL